MPSDCVGDETIAALLEGRLAAAGAARTRAHLATCAECRKLVAAAVEELSSDQTLTAGAASADERADPLAPGTLLAGKYLIERALGQGGMGRVLVARQRGLDRPVAVKILHPDLARDPLALQRFEREARMVAALTSEHVVRVHDFGELPSGEPYLVMELLEGQDLATIVAAGPVDPEHARAWIRAAAEALAEAHALGMVHRDIKPSNLFLTRAGRLKVLDFGLAKLAPPRTSRPPGTPGTPGAPGAMTHTGVILGSPHYMAPEQILGAREVDGRADLWSLGATLFHLLRGYPPFAQNTLDSVFASILSGWTPPLDGVRPALAAIITRALARDPAARFGSAAELIAALDAARPEPSPRPRRWGAAALAVGAVAITATVAITAWRSAPEAPRAAPELVAAGPREPAPGAREDAPPSLESSGERTSAPAREAAAAVAAAAPAAPGDAALAPEAAPGARARRRGDEARDVAGSAGTPERSTGSTRPVAPTSPAPAPRAASLDNLDEARLQARLAKLGWKVTMVAHDSFPGCDHTRMTAAPSEGPAADSADLFVLDCVDAPVARAELTRLRHGFPRAWFTLDGARLFMVLLGDEARSRALSDALLAP
ncbi:MAG: serine/threonine-protein kinase [Kofleriaceae bacterium]